MTELYRPCWAVRFGRFGALLALTASLVACKGRGEDRLPLEARAIQGTYGWGYEVLVDKKVFIHQEYIPAVQGYHGFSSKEDALRVASLAMNKIHLGKVPVISVHELDSLGIAIPRPAAPGSGH